MEIEKQKAHRYIHAPVDTLSLTKEARIYNGEKTISLTSAAGKLVNHLLKNETRTLSKNVRQKL